MNTSNEIICVSDAGCIFDKNWIYEIQNTILDYEHIDVVGGFFEANCNWHLEKLYLCYNT